MQSLLEYKGTFMHGIAMAKPKQKFDELGAWFVCYRNLRAHVYIDTYIRCSLYWSCCVCMCVAHFYALFLNMKRTKKAKHTQTIFRRILSMSIINQIVYYMAQKKKQKKYPWTILRYVRCVHLQNSQTYTHHIEILQQSRRGFAWETQLHQNKQFQEFGYNNNYSLMV